MSTTATAPLPTGRITVPLSYDQLNGRWIHVPGHEPDAARGEVTIPLSSLYAVTVPALLCWGTKWPSADFISRDELLTLAQTTVTRPEIPGVTVKPPPPPRPVSTAPVRTYVSTPEPEPDPEPAPAPVPISTYKATHPVNLRHAAARARAHWTTHHADRIRAAL